MPYMPLAESGFATRRLKSAAALLELRCCASCELFVVQLKITERFELLLGRYCSLWSGAGKGITPSPRRQRTMRRATTLLRRRTTSTHVWQASSCAAGEDGHRLRAETSSMLADLEELVLQMYEEHEAGLQEARPAHHACSTPTWKKAIPLLVSRVMPVASIRID